MLPQSFKLPGCKHDCIDLRELFEMNNLPGRFRDWIRRAVRPLLGTAVMEYTDPDVHGNQKSYCVAEPNAQAILALEGIDHSGIQLPCPMTYTRRHEIFIPLHGFSVNKMYEPNSHGRGGKDLRRTAEYNEWISRAVPHVGRRPRWLRDLKFVQYEFCMSQGSDTDNLEKSAQDLVFQHAWRGNDAAVLNASFHGTRATTGHWIKVTIYG